MLKTALNLGKFQGTESKPADMQKPSYCLKCNLNAIFD